MKAFDIFLQGDWIDTVFYNSDFTCEEVRISLIQHDNFNPNIEVRDEH